MIRRWIIHRVTAPSPGGSVTSAYSSLSRADPDHDPVPRVYAIAECKRTGHEPQYSDSDWARVAGAEPAGWEADGSRGMDGPCRSRGSNQEEAEPIRDSAPCPSRDGGGGPPGPLAAGCWPAPTPDSDRVSQRHCWPTAMRTRARSSCGCAGRGLERAPRQPQMPMTAMVIIPPSSASCRPRHRVTARRGQ